MKAADECFSSLKNTWVSHSQSTLYTLINYEFAESDLQHTQPCCITRRGKCQESVSFTQGGVFKAACLHPAGAQNINCRPENRIKDNRASIKMDPVTEESLTYTSIFLCSPVWSGPVWLSPVALSDDLRKEMLWVKTLLGHSSTVWAGQVCLMNAAANENKRYGWWVMVTLKCWRVETSCR